MNIIVMFCLYLFILGGTFGKLGCKRQNTYPRLHVYNQPGKGQPPYPFQLSAFLVKLLSVIISLLQVQFIFLLHRYMSIGFPFPFSLRLLRWMVLIVLPFNQVGVRIIVSKKCHDLSSNIEFFSGCYRGNAYK